MRVRGYGAARRTEMICVCVCSRACEQGTHAGWVGGGEGGHRSRANDGLPAGLASRSEAPQGSSSSLADPRVFDVDAEGGDERQHSARAHDYLAAGITPKGEAIQGSRGV